MSWTTIILLCLFAWCVFGLVSGLFCDWYLGEPTKWKHIIWWYPLLGLLILVAGSLRCLGTYQKRGGFKWWNKVVFYNDGNTYK